jgi:hypothetical protein
MGTEGNLGLSQFLFHRHTKEQQKRMEFLYILSRKLKDGRSFHAIEDSSSQIPEKKTMHETSKQH